MDNQQAKFILQSFRPDGADAQDLDFAEALGLAAEDRELGEWLTQERARDAAFAAALSDVPIPEDLREAIFGMLEEAAPEMTDFDYAFVGALASVTPPVGLRDQILNAMEVEQKVITTKLSSWKKWSTRVAAVAAVLAISFVGLTKFAGPKTIAGTNSEEIHQSAINLLSSPIFSLDLKNPNQEQLFTYLKSQDLPAPEQLPAGLQGLEGVGCKYLEIGENKSRASLICFRQENDNVVHLVMMKKEEIDHSDLPQIGGAIHDCARCESEKWSTTQWSDEQYAFLMLSQMEPAQLAALF